ncbi:hypothetical protein R3P38DRAFT_3425152, partial [Favolaschia claudopus]
CTPAPLSFPLSALATSIALTLSPSPQTLAYPSRVRDVSIPPSSCFSFIRSCSPPRSPASIPTFPPPHPSTRTPTLTPVSPSVRIRTWMSSRRGRGEWDGQRLRDWWGGGGGRWIPSSPPHALPSPSISHLGLRPIACSCAPLTLQSISPNRSSFVPKPNRTYTWTPILLSQSTHAKAK